MSSLTIKICISTKETQISYHNILWIFFFSSKHWYHNLCIVLVRNSMLEI